MKYNRMCDKLHIFRNKGFFQKNTRKFYNCYWWFMWNSWAIFGILGIISLLLLNLALSFGFTYFCVWATIWVINLFIPFVITTKVMLVSAAIIFVAQLVIGGSNNKK